MRLYILLEYVLISWGVTTSIFIFYDSTIIILIIIFITISLIDIIIHTITIFINIKPNNWLKGM